MNQFFLRYLRRRRYPLLIEPENQRSVVIRFALYLAGVVFLHALAMMGLEDLTFGEALWLTFTTIVTVGYGDYAAETTAGRVATVVLIYLGGVFVLFEAAAVYFEYRSERRQRMIRGRWRWRMKDHILLLNAPNQNPAQYLCRLASEFRSSRRYGDLPILVLTGKFPEGLPDALRQLGVVHCHGDAANPRDLEAAGAKDAAIIVVLAREAEDEASDGRTFDTVSRLSEMGARGRILAECVSDRDRSRLSRAGAAIVVRPLRGYPEMIVRGLVAPGAELILEDLFTSRGDECWRYDIGVRNVRWIDIVRTLAERDIGLAVGYRACEDRSVRINPRPETVIDADKLYVIVREGNNRPDAEIERLLREAESSGPPGVPARVEARR